MAMRNASCPYQRSLRSQPTERPQPLRRGMGLGGGNYRRMQSAGAGGVAKRTCPAQARPPPESRPRSASSTSSRPVSPSSSASSSCPLPLGSKSRCPPSREQRPPQSSAPGSSSNPSVCKPGSSNMGIPQARPSTPSSAGSSSRCKVPSGAGTEDKIRTSSTCPNTRTRMPTGGPESPRAATATPTRRGSVRGTPSRSSSAARSPAPRSRPPLASGGSKARSMMSVSSPKPGPSCLRPPPNGAKRKVQFIGVPQQGPGPSPDSRTRYKNMSAAQMRNSRGQRNADSICEPGGGSQGQAYGPSLYPLYPDQYETPFVSMPGPRQVLLMPGDIDPNETTIIDIVGLSEGDVEEVPGIPPHAPASLLEDTWNEYLKDATEQDLKRRKGCGEMKSVKKTSCPASRGKKKEEQMFLPSIPNSNCIYQGRAFSFEEYGNVRVDDPNNPPYEGPSFKAPDPECQRARPFTYKSRKTTTRSFTDEERRDIEEAGMYRAIRAIINEYDAKWERDRTGRGLSGDELMDIDAEECAPSGPVQKAPRDIFSTTDQCGFGESYLPRSPEVSPMAKRPQCRADDLISWDEGANIPSSAPCDEQDLLTRTPPRSPMRRQSLPSPNLMSICEPDQDLLGLKTPPKPKSPSPCAPSPMRNRDDLIRWESPQAALPFDVTCEENLFDTVTGPSPTAARLRTPPLSSQRANGRSGQGFSQSCKPSCDFASPQREPRIVRAIPMEDDPNTVVLENSPLASRSPPCIEDSEESLGILDYETPCDGDLEPWQQMDNLEEDFHRPLPKGSNMCYNPDISGITRLDEFDDDDDLGILDEGCLPDFEYSADAETRLREEAKYQTMFQPLAAGGQYIDREECPFEPEFDELGRQFEDERADLLNLCHEPEVGPVQRKEFGRLGSELLEQCQDPIEQCQDLLGLMEPSNGSPQKRMGPFSRELLESCPEEQQLIDLNDECQTEQSSCSPRFSYSRDLFTNVQWDPSMAQKSRNSNEDQCPQ